MLNSDIIKKIENFVYTQPRSIHEIAQHIDKNWRTSDRYIDEIAKEYGTLAVKVFRGGTRGALKIVYWASIEKVNSSVFQQQLEKRILTGRTKYDFSAFDIYQHVEDKKKDVLVKTGTSEEKEGLKPLKDLLLSAQKQILIFSGNLSFTNFKDKENDTFKVIEEIARRGISIKIVCRVDLVGKENVEKILALNFKNKKETIEVHHMEQPLRAIIIDDKLFNIKEILEPSERNYESKKKVFLFYMIKDKEWVLWLSRIFWSMFSSSISAHKRISELKKIL